jgi:hypothetical protein
LSPLKKTAKFQNKHLNIARGKKSKMARTGTEAVVIEQKKSYGIGGAGNISKVYPSFIDL